MQLMLKIDERTRQISEIHARLLQYFGHQGPYFQLDPVSQLVMGIIGGRTRSEVSKHAYERLRRRYRNWEELCDASVDDIWREIHAVTFADVKAPRLRAAMRQITESQGRLTLDHLEDMSVEEAHSWLEQLPGVGRKVSATVLNFSTLRKRTIVIDTHHIRILRRLGIVSVTADFRKAHETTMPLLPDSWTARDIDEHHQLMKALGQTFCRHKKTNCFYCPLHDCCRSKRAVLH